MYIGIISLFFLLLSILNVAQAETSKSIEVFNYPVEQIYYINNPKNGEYSWGYSYEDACNNLGEDYFWGLVPSKSDRPACYSVKSYNMIIGTDSYICADGNMSYHASPSNYCTSFMACQNGSWSLSEDKKTCTRKEPPCEIDPAAVSEEQILAAIAYGESHWSNVYEEMAAVANAVVRRKTAKGFYTINELVLKDPSFAYAANPASKNERYQNIMCGISSAGVELAYRAAQNALNNGYDYANEGCFWDGLDLKIKGPDHYRYKAGFKITKKSHNVLLVDEPIPFKRKGPNGKDFSTTYQSTAGLGKSILWKYTKEFLTAGGIPCI